MRLYWHLVTLDDYEMVAKMPSMQSKINNTVIRKETTRTCHNSNIEQRFVWIRGIALPMTNVQLGDFQKCFSMYCLFMFIYYYLFFNFLPHFYLSELFSSFTGLGHLAMPPLKSVSILFRYN